MRAIDKNYDIPEIKKNKNNKLHHRKVKIINERCSNILRVHLQFLEGTNRIRSLLLFKLIGTFELDIALL